MLGVNVAGGTNAGFRNPFLGEPMPWQCDCLAPDPTPTTPRYAPRRKTNAGYLASCNDCRKKRPRQRSS